MADNDSSRLIGSTARITRVLVHTATRNSDLDEGRGCEVLIGHFQEAEIAKQAALKQDVMGTNGSVRSAHRFVIEVPLPGSWPRSSPPKPLVYLLGDRVFAELPPNKEALKQALKQAAIAKLTPEELAALTT